MKYSFKLFALPVIIVMTVLLAVVVVAGVTAQMPEFNPFERGTASALPADDQVTSAPTAASADSTAQQLLTANCRYGVGNVKPGSSPWIDTLGAGWFVNFMARDPGASNAEFVPLLTVRQNRDKESGTRLPSVAYGPPLAHSVTHENGTVRKGLGQFLADNPGQLILVGNEVDVDNLDQGNTMPEVYASAYHDAYHYIKEVDPTARVAVAGLSMMTEGRMQYLDIVWDTYKDLYGTEMPVDVWNMHLYILHERLITEPEDFPAVPAVYGDGKIALGTDPALAKKWAHTQWEFCPDPDHPDTAANDPAPEIYCRSEHDSVRIFQEQVLNMRQWMKDHGQQDKPLIISEFGLLYPYETHPDGRCDYLKDDHGRCFDRDRVTDYMNGTLEFLETATDPNLGYPRDENRLVQRWLWYAVSTQPNWSGAPSNLVECNYDGADCDFSGYAPGALEALTQMGEAYLNAATTYPTRPNLVAGVIANVNAHLDFSNTEATAEISVKYRNTGAGNVATPFNVTFYSDAALSQAIGTVKVTPEGAALSGCNWDNRSSRRAAVAWSGLSVGTHPYWAVIDSDNGIDESAEDDNVTVQGTVIVNGSSLFVPLVSSN